MRWLKHLAIGAIGTGILLGAPVIPQDMKWVVSYETIEFDTADGDLGVNQYAVADEGWYVRIGPKAQTQFVTTANPDDIKGKSEVKIRCERCAYYDEFIDGERIYRVQTTRDGYDGLRYLKDYPQPKRSKNASVLSGLTTRAAIAYDDSTQSLEVASASSISWSHTNTGSELIDVVTTSMDDITDADRTVTALTYNAVSLTSLREDDNNTSDNSIAIWYGTTTTTGSNTVAITYNGTITKGVGFASSYTGVSAPYPLSAQAGTTATDANSLSTTITTLADNATLVDTVYMEGTLAVGVVVTPSNGQTTRETFDNSGIRSDSGLSELATSTGITTIGWGDGGDASTDEDWSYSAIGLQPSGSAYAFPASNDDDAGVQPPTTPNNLRKCDAVIGSWTSANDPEHYKNFGLSIPAGATIDGIKVRLAASVDTAIFNTSADLALSWNGATSYTSTKSTSDLTTTRVVYTLGGSTDTWGRSWTVTELNDANFRIRVDSDASAALMSVDCFAVYVYYTPVVGIPGPNPSIIWFNEDQ